MGNFKNLIAILGIVLKTRWKQFSIPVIMEFIFVNVGDLLQPKFNIVFFLFLFFLAITLYCFYRVNHWIKTKKPVIPISKNQLFNAPNALSDSIIKGLPLASIGVVLSAVLLCVQLAFGSKNNNGAIANLIPGLQPIQNTLLGIDSKLDTISQKLDNVKQETSKDPRKELQNRGVEWNEMNFLDQVKNGDLPNLSLFLQGGMHPETAQSEGRCLPVMLALNKYNPGQVLDLLLKNGLDINYRFTQRASMNDMQMTLLSRAIEGKNIKLAEALVKNKADTKEKIETFASYGFTGTIYPLQSAIYWKQYEIAGIILESGTDISVGDYAAYRQVYLMKKDYFWKEHPAEWEELLKKTAPPKELTARIDTELRLEEIAAEITEAANNSFKSYANPYNKRMYDDQIKVLEEERAILKKKLENMK